MAPLLLGLASCGRLADTPGEEPDYEALREQACAAACTTMDTCEPDRFAGQDPDDCFTRCTTLLPRLHEENQCGSRQIISLECVGELSCEGYEAYDASQGEHDYSVPCVTESHWNYRCDKSAPFDLEEPVPAVP